jgi:hypothetical protein
MLSSICKLSRVRYSTDWYYEVGVSFDTVVVDVRKNGKQALSTVLLVGTVRDIKFKVRVHTVPRCDCEGPVELSVF